MKKYFPLAACALMFAACSQKPGYEITGKVANADLNGKYVYLYTYGSKEAPLDSALVENGAFTFKGSKDMPSLSSIRFAPEVVEKQRAPMGDNSPFSVNFVLENGMINILLDSISTATGTSENDDHTAFQTNVRNLRLGMNNLKEDFKSKDTAIVNAAERKYEEIDRKITEVVVNYILNHQNKQTAAKNLYDFRYNIDEDQQNKIIDQSDSTFKSVAGISDMIKHLNTLKTVAVGRPFVNFEMAGPDGKMHQLSEYVGNGKVTLIDFWASWCGPCRKSMPELVELYKQYKNKGFEIVGVSLDNNAEAWAKGTKDLKITWPQLSDLKGWQNSGAELYGVNSIPHTVLVDKEGVVVGKNLYGDELKTKLKELLK